MTDVRLAVKKSDCDIADWVSRCTPCLKPLTNSMASTSPIPCIASDPSAVPLLWSLFNQKEKVLPYVYI